MMTIKFAIKLIERLSPSLAAAVAAGGDVPWGAVHGAHGRLFVTKRRFLWGSFELRETVHLDGLPLLERGADHYRWSTVDRREARERREALRASRREASRRYERAVSTALSLVARGVPLTYTEGQRGGVFTHPSFEGCVSAPRLARECGLSLDDAIEGIVEGALGERPLASRARGNPVAFSAAAG